VTPSYLWCGRCGGRPSSRDREALREVLLGMHTIARTAGHRCADLEVVAVDDKAIHPSNTTSKKIPKVEVDGTRRVAAVRKHEPEDGYVPRVLRRQGTGYGGL